MPIEISWEAGAPPPDLDEALLRRGLATFLQVLGREGFGLSLVFAGDEELRALNRDHRGLDRATDVLSWCYDESPEISAHPDLDGRNGVPPLWGELALSLERAQAQARQNGWSREVELMRLLAHGCAHLAGYGHDTPEEERVMLGWERKMLAAAGVSDLYPLPEGLDDGGTNEEGA